MNPTPTELADTIGELLDGTTEGPWQYDEDMDAGEITVRAGSARLTHGTYPSSYSSTDMIAEVDVDFPLEGDEDDPETIRRRADALLIATAPTLAANQRTILTRIQEAITTAEAWIQENPREDKGPKEEQLALLRSLTQGLDPVHTTPEDYLD